MASDENETFVRAGSVPPSDDATTRGLRLPSQPRSGPSRSEARVLNLVSAAVPGGRGYGAPVSNQTLLNGGAPTNAGVPEALVDPTLQVEPLVRAREAVEAMRSTRWHVVFPAEDPQQTLVTSTVTPIPDPMQVPTSAVGVVVVALFSNMGLAQAFISDLTRDVEHLPPIVVLLIASDQQEEEGANEILNSQLEFRRVGGAEVVLQRSTGAELVMDITLSFRRAISARVLMRREVNRLLVQHDNSLFWSSVHRMFAGFPIMSNDTVPVVDGALLNQRYQLMERIGRGAFSEVHRAQDTAEGEEVAVKLVGKEHLLELEHVTKWWNEFRLMSQLDHPNIAKMKHLVHTRTHIFFVLEFAGRPNLYQHVRSLARPMSIDDVGQCQKQIASGVAYCHAHGVAHRDIKPENLAMRTAFGEGPHILKIVDFGCSVTTTAVCSSMAGTMPFIAPEAMSANPYEPACVDVWACGLTLLEMMCGIGKVSKLIEVNYRTLPTAQTARQFVDFFGIPGSILDAVQADLGPVGTPQFPQAFCDLLLGALNPAPQQRWDSTRMEVASMAL